jgi:hypothetical protein
MAQEQETLLECGIPSVHTTGSALARPCDIQWQVRRTEIRRNFANSYYATPATKRLYEQGFGLVSIGYQAKVLSSGYSFSMGPYDGWVVLMLDPFGHFAFFSNNNNEYFYYGKATNFRFGKTF